jgi:IS5 family transposase
VPHPTTLVKLGRRAGPEVVEELNAALLHKLAAGKLLRPASCGRHHLVGADIDCPTDADLLEHAVRKLGGWSGGRRSGADRCAIKAGYPTDGG